MKLKGAGLDSAAW